MSGTTRSRRIAAALALVLVLLAGIAVLGRWERGRNAATQNRRMAAVFRLATSRGLDSPLLDEYRLASTFDCLLYHPAGRPRAMSAYELCFDSHGRLVQTIDRSSGSPKFASLQEQPSLSTLHVPVDRVMRIFAVRGVLAKDPGLAGVKEDVPMLPLVDSDIGAHSFPRAAPG